MTKKAKELTLTHKEILRYIIGYVQKEGYPPSYREIQTATGLSSTSLVWNKLSRLQDHGLLRIPERGNGNNGRTSRAIDIRPAIRQDWDRESDIT